MLYIKKYLSFITILSVLSTTLYANLYLKKGEKLLYGFKTQKGKILSITIGANNSYIVYRYGKKDKVELEYPKKDKKSFSHFTYTSYFRGGGAQNEGLDLQYLKFSKGNYSYTIFDEYSAAEDSRDIGIKVFKKGKKKALIIIKGDLNTIKGSLSNAENLPIKKEWIKGHFYKIMIIKEISWLNKKIN